MAYCTAVTYLFLSYLSKVLKCFCVACGSKNVIELGLQVFTLTEWPVDQDKLQSPHTVHMYQVESS